MNTSSGWDGEPEFVALDHPMTQRLHYWIDQLDGARPEALRATPKPQIILRKSAEPNAWVSFIPVQWDVRTRHAGGPPDAGAPVAALRDARLARVCRREVAC